MAGQVELQIGPTMIEEVMKDYEREHPGHDASEMTSTEFADRMMAKVMDTARVGDQSNH